MHACMRRLGETKILLDITMNNWSRERERGRPMKGTDRADSTSMLKMFLLYMTDSNLSFSIPSSSN